MNTQTKTKINANLQWLKDNYSFLSINAIASDLNMPQRSLSAFVKNERPLKQEWQQPLIDWVKKFRS